MNQMLVCQYLSIMTVTWYWTRHKKQTINLKYRSNMTLCVTSRWKSCTTQTKEAHKNCIQLTQTRSLRTMPSTSTTKSGQPRWYPASNRLASSPWYPPYIGFGGPCYRACTPRERGSARFSADSTHRTTRPWPAWILFLNICTYKVWRRRDWRSVLPVPFTSE
jgi:hypothetical protein